jgi:membrane associated rhomboid family serine protease
VQDREPIFNVPGSVTIMIGSLILVHALRNFLSIEDDNWFVIAMAFVPARYAGEAGLLPGAPWAAQTSFLTHMVVHGDWFHLAANCAWLLAFGGALARRIGGIRFVAFTVFCGLAAICFFWLLNVGAPIPVIGASGAVSGMMAGVFRFFFSALQDGGFARLNADPTSVRRMGIGEALTNPQVLVAIGAFLVLNLIFGFGGAQLSDGNGIAWEAHIGGFIAGLFMFGFFDRRVLSMPPSSL